eukprot:CAMPEP_0201487300 /NCGR_PEP_ID=MMETSP0151_2-20130828/12196_1 /ASSEMBLY_ACC=CAM_ASM_000257 /TAXON_ID=200890 /ORGANISM="Paramoeba atlantica, Strain 621/1 / CCAP 1560/9" /LENGTH=324 /DNA_ID=CAMNT_0047872299 /DNA_START=100 /DNA_END=1074 /DNA_ORIENTATION=-
MAEDQPAPEGVKVFVGNLSFQVGKEELEKQFSDAGQVRSANVIMRGSRSRGYGFVEMNTIEEAEKAVELLNRREIDGRPVNVELAKPREEGEEKKGDAPAPAEGARPRRGRGRGRGRGGRGGRRRGRGGAEGEEGEDAPPADAPAAAAAAPAAAADAPAAAAEGAAEGGEGDGGARPRRARRSRGRGRGGRGARGGARGVGRGARGGARGGRGGAGGVDLREPSSDTLFVANLPFTTKDEELKDFFKEYNPTKAYVVVGRNGRSKGFGFVCFENDGDQQAALNLDGAPCEERPIAVRVALNPEPRLEKQEEEAAAPNEEEKKSE